MRARPLNALEFERRTLCRTTIAGLLPSGEIVVRPRGGSEEILVCDYLETGAKDRPALQEGDRVLVLLPEDPGEKGCVLGKVGPYRAPDRRKLVMDADEELTIRCGKGSITIRKSGKILVRGLEIVSHAQGANRIRGGSIQLN
jgi:hypothetical protein